MIRTRCAGTFEPPDLPHTQHALALARRRARPLLPSLLPVSVSVRLEKRYMQLSERPFAFGGGRRRRGGSRGRSGIPKADMFKPHAPRRRVGRTRPGARPEA